MIIKKNKDIPEDYLKDASNYRGNADALYIPESVDELKNCLKSLYNEEVPITLAGAGTGLTGGRVPAGGALISTEKLNKFKLSNDGRTIISQPGVLLNDIESFLNEKGLFYPPDPTETNSSIGGNIATNASGSKTFKYGPTRDYVLAINAVLPDGDEINLRRGEVFANGFKLNLATKSGRNIYLRLPELVMPEVKHAAGYYIKEDMDAIDLLIGQEGTLCVIAEAELRLLPKPKALMGGMVFFNNDIDVFEFVREIKTISIANHGRPVEDLRDISARAVEFYDSNALDFIRDKYPQLPDAAKAAIWFQQEYYTGNEDHLMKKYYSIIQKHTGLADSTWLAIDDKGNRDFRQLRHDIPLQINEYLSRKGQTKIGTDNSVPDEYLMAMYNFIKIELQNLGLEYVIFGHIGNSHLHANVFTSDYSDTEKAWRFYEILLNQAVRWGGSISAEHGLGKLKKKYLSTQYSNVIIEKMKLIKKAFDPKMLLGKGTLFD
ncbi:MAG: FAD-binding oxidoreductase [Candidatus Kapaibacterium sp.]